MSTPNSIIKIHGDRYAGAFALQKLQALVAAQQDAAGHDELDQAPSSSLQRDSTSAPHMQPSDKEDIPVKIIQISTDSAQTTHIVGNLGDKYELSLVTFLWDNVDVFARQPSQMTWIPREVIEHYLKIYPDVRPVQQNLEKQSIEWQNFIRKEIKKLLDAGFIRKVHYP
jgi:hypothetical protein